MIKDKQTSYIDKGALNLDISYFNQIWAHINWNKSVAKTRLNVISQLWNERSESEF